MKIPEIHIGKEIEKVLESKPMTKAEFARKVGIAPQNLRGIFERPKIDTDRLKIVCETLDFNFFDLYKPAGTKFKNESPAISDSEALSVSIGKLATAIENLPEALARSITAVTAESTGKNPDDNQ